MLEKINYVGRRTTDRLLTDFVEVYQVSLSISLICENSPFPSLHCCYTVCAEKSRIKIS